MKLHWPFITLSAFLLFVVGILPPVEISPASAQFEFLVERVKPAVVLVSVRHTLGDEKRGSGFIYDSAGFILTNQHVVEGATEISVTLPDRRRFRATVVDYVHKAEYSGAELQAITDVAVLKIDASGLPALSLGDSDTLRQGQEILVFGYPGGVGTEEVSVSRGIVSATRMGWVQTDAAIVPGNSGGPVVDGLGRVVGLATFVTGPSALFVRIGGVVSINVVKGVASSALTPGASRYQVMSIPGMEYVASIAVGRKSRTRETYDPGVTRNQPQVVEFSYEIVSVQNFAGALLYVLRNSNGGEVRNIFGSEGIYQVSISEPGWTYAFPSRQPLLLLPPLVGRVWQNQVIAENIAQGVRRSESENWQVESTNDIISTTMGSFQQVLRLRATFLTVIARGSQITTYHGSITQWNAPGLGNVRSIREILETRERISDETVSVQY